MFIAFHVSCKTNVLLKVINQVSVFIKMCFMSKYDFFVSLDLLQISI